MLSGLLTSRKFKKTQTITTVLQWISLSCPIGNHSFRDPLTPKRCYLAPEMLPRCFIVCLAWSPLFPLLQPMGWVFVLCLPPQGWGRVSVAAHFLPRPHHQRHSQPAYRGRMPWRILAPRRWQFYLTGPFPSPATLRMFLTSSGTCIDLYFLTLDRKV